MPKPLIGLSMMLEKDFLAATLPLFESAMVEVVEWSPDIGWSRDTIPQWAQLLLGEYSENGRLLGHGVQFSPLNAGWSNKDQRWIDNLRTEVKVRKVLHFSEHFGCANSPDFVAGAPLPVPYTRQLLKSSAVRIQRMQDAAQTGIGLENLALAFSLQDVREQGAFLEELLQPVEGFLLLDLHNLYCQMINFDIGADEILSMYPLHRVRELHVSGGSWSVPSSSSSLSSSSPSSLASSSSSSSSSSIDVRQSVRRDTHDGRVPTEVWDLLRIVLKKCSVSAVILERLGGTMPLNLEQSGFRDDFYILRKIVDECTASALSNAGLVWLAKSSPIDSELSPIFHRRLMLLLNTAASPAEVLERLKQEFQSDQLHNYIYAFQPEMIEVAQQLMQKWAVADVE